MVVRRSNSYMRLILLLIMAFVSLVIYLFSIAESYESKEELLKNWSTDKLFYTNKDQKNPKYIYYDLISDVYYTRPDNNIYNIKDFDRGVIDVHVKDKNVRTQNSLVI